MSICGKTNTSEHLVPGRLHYIHVHVYPNHRTQTENSRSNYNNFTPVNDLWCYTVLVPAAAGA